MTRPGTPPDLLTAAALDRLAGICERLARDQACDVDVEFAFEDIEDEPWILQCRPVTSAERAADALRNPAASATGEKRGGATGTLRLRGLPCSHGIATGRAFDRRQHPSDSAAGDLENCIVILERLTVDDIALAFRCAGIVTERRDAQLSHAAIACREAGVPYVAGIADAGQLLGGRRIVVDGSTGEVRIVAGSDEDAAPAVRRAPSRSADEPRNAATPLPTSVESASARFERLLLEALPSCNDLVQLRRHLAHSYNRQGAGGGGADGGAGFEIDPATITFTSEEAELIRRHLGFDPGRDGIAALVRWSEPAQA